MVMKTLREGAKGGLGKFILFGFLGLAVGGLVLMDVGGFFRNGTGSNNAIKVDGEAVSIQDFDRKVRRSLGNIGITPQDAYKLGYMEQLISAQIREILMRNLANDTDVEIDRKRIAAHIVNLIKPLTQDGQSTQDVLRQILVAQGMSEAQFASAIEYEMKNALIEKTIYAGAAENNPALVDALYKFQYEQRDIEYIKFHESEIKMPVPTEDDLRALYEEIKSTYVIPETRNVQIISIDTDRLKKTIDVPEEELRAEYNAQIDLYRVPETRTIEQAFVDLPEQATKIHEQLQNNVPFKLAVRNATGGESAYLGEQSLAKNALPEDIADAVWDAKAGTTLPPIETPLGAYVVVVKSINPEETKSFDDLRDELYTVAIEDALIDQSHEISNTLQDLVAAGTPLEDIKAELPVTIVTINGLNGFGQDITGTQPLDTYGDKKPEILEEIFSMQDGDEPIIIDLSNADFLAIKLDSIQPQSIHPFEQLQSQLKSRWLKDQQGNQTFERANSVLDEIENKKLSLKQWANQNSRAYRTDKNLKRGAKSDPFGERQITNIFAIQAGEPAIVDIDGGYAIVSVTKSTLPEITDTIRSSDKYADLDNALKSTAQDEILQLVIEKELAKTSAKINRPLLDRIYGSESDTY